MKSVHREHYSSNAAQTPGIISGLMSRLVSVKENGSKVQLQQSISWQPPVSADISMYLVRYGMGDLEDASFLITTQNTSIVLTLSVPDGPLDMVVYNIWVAVVTKSKEHGNATELTIKYSSELQPVTVPVTTVITHIQILVSHHSNT